MGLAVLAIVLLIGGYNWRAFKNMATQEAMDAAQLARNLAQGKGYTTLFIRPFSMYLVKKHNLETQGAPPAGKVADLAEIRGHASRPGQPAGLSGGAGRLMKVLPFDYTISTTKPFWSNGRQVLALRTRFPHRPVQPASVSGAHRARLLSGPAPV